MISAFWRVAVTEIPICGDRLLEVQTMLRRLNHHVRINLRTWRSFVDIPKANKYPPAEPLLQDTVDTVGFGRQKVGEQGN